MDAQKQHALSTPAAPERHKPGFAPGNPYRWQPGQSGNLGGRRQGTSFAAALAKQAVTPVTDRDEMTQIARTIGLDPQETRNIDVVAALFYTVLCRLMVRATSQNGRADERLVGMLQVLLRALDPAELRAPACRVAASGDQQLRAQCSCGGGFIHRYRQPSEAVGQKDRIPGLNARSGRVPCERRAHI